LALTHQLQGLDPTNTTHYQRARRLSAKI
jgi:hypothetical protein